MSNLSTPHAPLNGNDHHAAGHSDNDFFVDYRLDEEMKRLAAINQELLGKLRPDSHEQIELSANADEVAHLRSENAALRARLEELEPVLTAAAANEETWAERQKEYEALLEEKSEVIRSLHIRVQELLETQGAKPQKKTGPVQDEAVLALKKELEEQRRQLEEDERSLMEQMRNMEMSMSRDRAELARQRNEVQRLHADLNREIELAARDPGLRDRLIALQRRHQEPVAPKPRGMGLPEPLTKTPVPQPAPQVPEPGAAPKKQSSGLLRRIFGGGS